MAFEHSSKARAGLQQKSSWRCVGAGIVEELDRCWEVTQDQDQASKIEKALFETQRDVKMETTFMSYVARRKLDFQQLENALGTPLPAVIKGYATLRDAKVAECSYDKVEMWTGGSYDYDDVMRALVRLDRSEMRPGTSGQSGKTVPTYFTDLEVDAPTIVSGSEIWTQPNMDQPHWNEVLDALQEDVDFCEEGETTIARDGAIAIPGVFYNTDDGQETIEENGVPQILLQAQPAFRHPGYRAVREDLNAAQKSRGFFGPRRGGSGREQGPRMKRSSIHQLKLRTRCARCRKLGHWARECLEGNRGPRNEERYDRRAVKPGENSRGFVTVAKPTERIPFFLAPPRHSSFSTLEKSCGTLVPKRDSSGNSNLTNGVNCSRNTVSNSNGARRNQNPQAALEA